MHAFVRVSHMYIYSCISERIALCFVLEHVWLRVCLFILPCTSLHICQRVFWPSRCSSFCHILWEFLCAILFVWRASQLVPLRNFASAHVYVCVYTWALAFVSVTVSANIYSLCATLCLSVISEGVNAIITMNVCSLYMFTCATLFGTICVPLWVCLLISAPHFPMSQHFSLRVYVCFSVCMWLFSTSLCACMYVFLYLCGSSALLSAHVCVWLYVQDLPHLFVAVLLCVVACASLSERLWACATLCLSLCATWCPCPWSCVFLRVPGCTCLFVHMCFSACLSFHAFESVPMCLCVSAWLSVCASFPASLYECTRTDMSVSHYTSHWVFPQCLALFASLRVFACDSKQWDLRVSGCLRLRLCMWARASLCALFCSPLYTSLNAFLSVCICESLGVFACSLRVSFWIYMHVLALVCLYACVCALSCAHVSARLCVGVNVSACNS
jgi:hypothetical protein